MRLAARRARSRRPVCSRSIVTTSDLRRSSRNRFLTCRASATHLYNSDDPGGSCSSGSPISSVNVGVKKIDEIYSRWTRTPEEEPLPKMAQAPQSPPKPSQTVDPAVTVVAKSLKISKNFGDDCAPNRTRIVVRGKQYKDRQNFPQRYKRFTRDICSVDGREVTFCRRFCHKSATNF